MNYSVLMSVYKKEKPEYFRVAIESIFRQTLLTDDFVIVCDGPLTDELDSVIYEETKSHESIIKVIRLTQNMGLGYALNEGLKHCKNEVIARMDSDDISLPERCEIQLKCFQNDNRIDIVSGTVLEFTDGSTQITGRRSLPEKHESICIYSRKRNPFNHPAVMFKKSAVNAAGGYKEDFHLFEDYYLWTRMLMNGSVGYNIQQPLLLMRTPTDLYKRRGGKQYAADMLKYHKWLLQQDWTCYKDYWTGAVPHAVVCILPNWMRKRIYQRLHK